MGLLPNLSLPLPALLTPMALWSTAGIVASSTAWLFSSTSTADMIDAAPDYYDSVHVLWVAPVAASTNWVWSVEPG